MTVNTKSVKGRRQVRYENYDELLADAESLVANESTVNRIGNWSIGQVLQHLAKSLNVSIDGSSLRAPLPLRIILTLFMKKKLIYQAMPSGFAIPKSGTATFSPDDHVTAGAALEELRKAIARVKSDKTRANHGIFGTLSTDEWDNFSRRHAELHMSFLVPSG